MSERGALMLFGTLTLGAIAPVWAFPFIPTQDGPAHLANARILHRLADPASLHAQIFEVSLEPVPNWLSHALLWGLLWLMPAAIAEKVLVTGYVVGFAWSYRRLALAL